MRDIPQTRLAAHSNTTEIKELRFGAGFLVRGAGERVPVVERFWQAEDVDEPGGAEDDGGDPVAPTPAGVFGGYAADDGGEMGAVGYAGGWLARRRKGG
jgi:hypothetical protein